MQSGSELGDDSPRLPEVLRRLAADAPSDDDLLAGVHRASARATVRRRALAASVAAVTVVGVAATVSAQGSAGPGGSELLLGASDTPAPSPVESPSSGPAVPTQTEGAATTPDGTSGLSDTYHGRAVSPDGRPIAGLYLHGFNYLDGHAVEAWTPTYLGTRTGDDGTFELPCQDGWVARPPGVDPLGWDTDRLSSVMLLPLNLAGDWIGPTPNWRPTFIGGGYREEEMHPVRCTTEVETTVVPPGAVLEGVLRAPAHCGKRPWLVHAIIKAGAWVERGTFFSSLLVPGERFRVTSLWPGEYVVGANTYDTDEPFLVADDRRVTVSGSQTHTDDIVLGEDCGAQVTPTAAPTTAPEASPAPSPAATPTPEPEAS